MLDSIEYEVPEGFMLVPIHDHEHCYEREVYERARDAYQTTILDLQKKLRQLPVEWPARDEGL